MPPIVRLLLAIIFTTQLVSLVTTTGLNHDLLVILFTALLTYDLWWAWWFYHYWPTTVAALLSSLLTFILTGMGSGVTSNDTLIVLVTVLLTITLARPIYNIWFGRQDFGDIPALVIAILTAIVGWLWLKSPTQPTRPVAGTIVSEHTRDRLIKAIGGDGQKVKTELQKRFGDFYSDTWNNSLGREIPRAGPWQLRMFFPNFIDEGDTITQGLWGRSVHDLKVDDNVGSLQPLLDCRNATNRLLKYTDSHTPYEDVYTPFFDKTDFGQTNEPYHALRKQVYQWVEQQPQQQAIRQRYGCDINQYPHTLLAWLKACVEPVEITTEDAELQQRIRDFGVKCRAVQFAD